MNEKKPLSQEMQVEAALAEMGCIDLEDGRNAQGAAAEAVAAYGPVLEALGDLAPAVAPPPGLKARLRAQLAEMRSTPGQPWKRWAACNADAGVVTIDPAELPWEATGIPGIESKCLMVDREGDRVTMMVRMAPGTSYPPHRHGGLEECMVLSGDLYSDNFQMKAGDYQSASKDSRHGRQHTREGCVLLINSSLQDELLETPA